LCPYVPGSAPPAEAELAAIINVATTALRTAAWHLLDKPELNARLPVCGLMPSSSI
jgi:hypothetical protein